MSGNSEPLTSNEDEDRPTPQARPNKHLARKTFASIAAFLTIISLLAATIGVWAHRTLLDTDTYVKTVTPLASDPAVIEAIASDLTSETMSLLDVESRIREALPEQFRFLSLPLSDAARNQIKALLVKAMETPQYKKLWVSANRLAHKTVVGILRNDLRYFDTANGEVQVDLILVAADVMRELGKHISFIGERLQIPEIASDATPAEVRAQVSAAIGMKIPDDFGMITLFKSEQLATAQRAVAAFDQLVVVLVVTTLILLAATIAISTRRFRMIAILGMGTILAVAVIDALVRNVETSAVASVADPTTRAALSAGIAALVGSLSGYLTFLFVGGGTFAVVGFVGSDTAPARAIRTRAVETWGRTASIREGVRIPESPFVRWLSENATLMRVGGLVVGVLAIFALRPSITGLLLLLLVLGGYEAFFALLGKSDTDSEGGDSSENSLEAPKGDAETPDGDRDEEARIGDQAVAENPTSVDSSPAEAEPDEADEGGAESPEVSATKGVGGNRLKRMLGGRGTAVLVLVGAAALALIAGWAIERRH